MPSEKRARQRAAREAKRAAEAKAARRRALLRNSVIVVVIAAVVVGSALYFVNRHSTPTKAAAKSTTTTTAKSTTTTTAATTTTTVPATTTTAPPTSTTTTTTPATTTTATTSTAAAEQAAANATATAAGCPATPKTRVNTLAWKSPPAMTIDTSKKYKATVDTTAGTFVITLDAKKAPKTVNSFVFLAKQGYFKCVIFQRVIPGFMDQTGDPTGTGTGGPGYQFGNENVPKSYATGDVAMAHSSEPSSDGSQFFIVVTGGAKTLDGDDTSKTAGYSLFGTVTKGMTVVNKINAEGNATSQANGTPPKVVQRMLSVTITTS